MIQSFPFLIILGHNEAFHTKLSKDIEKGLHFVHVYPLRFLLSLIKANCQAARPGDIAAAERLADSFIWKAILRYAPELAQFHYPVLPSDIDMKLRELRNKH